MNNREKILQGKIAVVTGASRGIGKAIATQISYAGAKVYVNYSTSEDGANAVVAAIKSAGGNAEKIRFDVRDETQVKEAIDRIVSADGKIDILVNNAGIAKDGLIMRMAEEDFTSVIDVNLKGTFLMTRAVLRFMVKSKWGRIVNISSVVGRGGREGQANYAASKAGIIGLTKSTAREVAKKNITCNAICPGFIETEMTSEMDQALKKSILEMIPAGRFGSPEDVAQSVLFLASDGAAYINGAVIDVNGGLYM